MSRFDWDKKGGTAEAQAFCPFKAEGLFVLYGVRYEDYWLKEVVVVARPASCGRSGLTCHRLVGIDKPNLEDANGNNQVHSQRKRYADFLV
jgi:hypothetical protein